MIIWHIFKQLQLQNYGTRHIHFGIVGKLVRKLVLVRVWFLCHLTSTAKDK